MWPNPQNNADLVTFTEKILNGKLHFLCSAVEQFQSGDSDIAATSILFSDTPSFSESLKGKN